MINSYFILFVFLIVFFIADIVLLVFSVMKNQKNLWIALYASEALSLGLSIGTMVFIDKIPSVASNSWTNIFYAIRLFISALIAGGLYVIMVIVSVILNIYKFYYNKKKENINGIS